MFEKVNIDVPLSGLHWFFDHAETISAKNSERVKALGGGIAVRHRMAYQGEDFAKFAVTGAGDDVFDDQRERTYVNRHS